MEPSLSVNFLPERLSPYCIIISFNFAAAPNHPTFDQSLSPIGKYFNIYLKIAIKQSNMVNITFH